MEDIMASIVSVGNQAFDSAESRTVFIQTKLIL